MAPHRVHVNATADGGLYRVKVVGELDVLSVPHFRSTMDTLLADIPTGTRVVLDASELTYVDSMGLGAIVATAEIVKRSGDELAIARPTDFVRSLLRITALDFLIEE